ncbi:M20 family metallopeptidase [Alkaliphilus pronyensis]|uniref:M20 family metallopeptidase n=1 Tax=Alkaliphilus pronyensis TaxID=1482732 RepID=A0A6I0EZB3_9FIRM|nr:Sapep family Mn(2+)-dependent dipeptidase [Alkaliphilus pronyensis]KAB3535298.1 M20 family metallopeptidase [Alkaliphilus pronyensis]
MDKLHQIILSYKEDIIRSTQELIRINSVNTNEATGKPFGVGIDAALNYVLQLGKSFGFKTEYYDGYYGYIEMGEGKELVGILTHVDVVPAGNIDEWKYPPFGGVIHHNRIYGRGSLDDKGPIIAALYSMRAVKEAGIPLNKRIRLFIGTNEESQWQCIEKYLQIEEVPSYGFVADSDYPLINAEKGLLQIKLYTDEKPDFIVRGGDAFNSVPDYCLFKSNNSTIEFTGRAAHSGKCWQGENAIVKAANSLYKAGIQNDIIDFIHKELSEDCFGTNIFGVCKDLESGTLTINTARINISDNACGLYLDIRYPVTALKEDILKQLQFKCSLYNIKTEVIDFLPPLFIPKENYLVQLLLKVYEEETGLKGEAISTGGATYARAIKNFVAFGPLFPGHEKMAHKKDEYIDIDLLIKNTLIYCKAIATLIKEKKQ